MTSPKQIGLNKLEQTFSLPDVVVLNEKEDCLVILDQTQLPEREIFLKIEDEKELIDAIVRLKVRGAPAIGVAAAAGLYVCFVRTLLSVSSVFLLKEEFMALADRIRASRPTAVNLSWALNRMADCFNLYINDKEILSEEDSFELKSRLLSEAIKIKDEDIEMCRQIASHGVDLISEGSRILTHCNAGHLAVSRYGTALAPIYLAQAMGLNPKIASHGVDLISEGSRILTHCNAGHLAVSRYGTALAPIYLAQAMGLNPKVYADETRPLLQGARLTAYELMRFGVDTTLSCDNMAASLMSRGMVDMVMVGCDRIAANGDVANKIGTCGLAVLSHHYGIPFYVLGPSSTFDKYTPTGNDIVIEQRSASEVTEMHYIHRMAPENVKVYNPAFDVTPASLVTAYVTEKGVFKNVDLM